MLEAFIMNEFKSTTTFTNLKKRVDAIELVVPKIFSLWLIFRTDAYMVLFKN